jgi:hypothetical protein
MLEVAGSIPAPYIWVYKYICLYCVWVIYKCNRLTWYGHVMWRDESHIAKRVMSMNVDGHPRNDLRRDRWTVWRMTWEYKEWAWIWQVVEENGRKKHVVSTPLSGDDDDDDVFIYKNRYLSKFISIVWYF